ncbi:ATP-binding cassette domain-containing protein [Cryobacterium melibiosiphilum]|uniref:ATP-binding cassette domain-containing protein n=3 Tax=Microbacteriaceae TaxID=85023 RepID=A0A4R8ZUR2_9MICO|nr:ATP-binding cassette domain-containing protein [Cryobacterium melibiosiphilum]TFD46787.1 ATP-binding cassette domain-containing protein [Cryobacterium frigoriphilum]
MLALAGPSGSGKTTLLNCIGLLERVDAGTITYGTRDATRPRRGLRRRLYRDSIGFLFQDSGLVDSWTVYDNVAIALGHQRLSRRNKQQQVENALERMGMGGNSGDRVHTLSGGEQQRVGLARLLLKNAQIVLADEPTASLDHGNSEMVIGALRDLADGGAAVVISTHDDRIIEASDGVVRLASGTRERGADAVVGWQ